MLVIFKALSSSKTSVVLDIDVDKHASQNDSIAKLQVHNGTLKCFVIYKDIESDRQIHPSLLILSTHGWTPLETAILIPNCKFKIQIRASQQCRVTKPFRIHFVSEGVVVAHSEIIVVMSAPPKGAEKMAFARGESTGKKWKLTLTPVPTSTMLLPVKYVN